MPKVYFVESDSGCARIADSEKEKLEAEVAAAIAGTRHCNVLLMLPGRHVVAMDVPDPAPAHALMPPRPPKKEKP